jgi:tetratricopeptide (TPR) repeat protein
VRQWGRRKNEDLWFLSDKTTMTFANETPAEDTTTNVTVDTTGGKKVLQRSTNPRDRKYYNQDIPVTPDMILASNNRIILAYYNLGFIYVEGLNDYQRSIGSFEKLVDRFPGNKYQVAACYKLYDLYKTLGNNEKSDYYKNLILTKYSQTDFAKLLVNPDYYKEIQARRKDASVLYEDTYKAFQNQQFYMVINNCDIATLKYSSDSVLMPKFEYLKALSTGKIDVQDSMVAGLKRIISRYPKSEVVPLASNILEYVKRQKVSKGKGTGGTDTTGVEEEPIMLPYTYNPNSVHFYILVVNNDVTDVNAQKNKIADFDDRFYDLDNLEVSSLLLEGNQEMITVNSFPNSEKAMAYFQNIKENKYVFTKLESAGGFSNFVISAENYPIFYKSKNIAQYQRFFKKNYGE